MSNNYSLINRINDLFRTSNKIKPNPSTSQLIQDIEKDTNIFMNETKSWFKEGNSAVDLQAKVNNLYKVTVPNKAPPQIIGNLLSNWMNLLPEETKNKSFIDNVILPGTHDSGAYKIDWQNSLNKSVFPLTSLGGKIPGLNHGIEKWTVTQNLDINDQLNHGIRLFDLRVSYNKDDNKFYIAHTLVTEKLEPMLLDFKKFLDQHPSEAVVINIKPDFHHRATMIDKWQSLGAMLKEYLGPKLVLPAEQNMSLNMMHASNKQAVVCLNGDTTLYHADLANDFWLNQSHEVWLEKGSVADKLKEIDNYFHAPVFPSSHAINYINYTVTPNASTLINFTLSNTAHKLNSQMLEVINKDALLNHHLTGLIMDYPTDGNIEKIIHFNM